MCAKPTPNYIPYMINQSSSFGTNKHEIMRTINKVELHKHIQHVTKSRPKWDTHVKKKHAKSTKRQTIEAHYQRHIVPMYSH